MYYQNILGFLFKYSCLFWTAFEVNPNSLQTKTTLLANLLFDVHIQDLQENKKPRVETLDMHIVLKWLNLMIRSCKSRNEEVLSEALI